MLDMDNDTLEALEESLYDLQHDLGKYVRLPVSMLPKDAPWETVVEQAIAAVERTRKGPSGVVSAKMLLDRFAADWEEKLASVSLYQSVKSAVAETAVLVGRIREGDSSPDRAEVEAVLGAVSEAIGRLMDEVLNG